MADVSKLKQNHARRLGPPPAVDEASNNLIAPEIAPAPVAALQAAADTYRRRDGRTLRKTNRTLAFATRVSPEFDERIRDIAERDGLLLVEVMERALDAYENQKSA
ncbi:hypothetical protein R75465_07397 [Paraburkholderia aspalathi]|uniref:hypothetical protein n=1 Tax=Paraburkholderia aspalathi TaxID=1324617 RepID=UPI001B227A04|nr:hypothetical protein [Paraburkholderia aspalathi]CAE6855666.1 hypothetical protein R75465_07397 [Paraburkholderia aspalathi]